jgi:hypothetical protein
LRKEWRFSQVAHRMSTLRQCDKIVFMAEAAEGAGSYNYCGFHIAKTGSCHVSLCLQCKYFRKNVAWVCAGGANASEEGTHEELMAAVRTSESVSMLLFAAEPCSQLQRA